MTDPFREAARIRKEGKTAEARDVLREALRRGLPDLERAGRLLQRDATGLTVRVLGQCTTAWIPPVLTAVAWGRGLSLRVTDADYDTILQDLDRHEPSDILVLIPWGHRLGSPEAIRGELSFWEAAWERRRGARLVQVGYDHVGPGPGGVNRSSAPGGRIDTVRAMNAALRALLPPGAAWVDLPEIAGAMGRDRFYDPRRYHWTKQPFSEEGLALLCRHLHAAIRAVTTGPKKLLVLDLDNTLWGGVVGETGPQGIAVRETPEGESFRAFQHHVKGLSQRGILLAVASKNNPEDAREPFLRNPDMVLGLDDFAGFEASWEPKAAALVRLADTLRLGLDSFVFFDDNPAEREHIRRALPEVEVVEVPEEPALYVRALEDGLWFEAVAQTAEDASRAGQYQVEAQRRTAEQAFATVDEYLASLDMVGDVRPVDDDDLDRVVQLLGKTNQFNLTTRRHGAEGVRAFASGIRLTFRLVDRFGDHGLVAVVLGAAEGDTIRIDSWLMSCRVIGRTLEEFVFASFLAEARGLGFENLTAEYVPTAKNAQVADLYDRLGLPCVEEVDGRRTYSARLQNVPAPRTFVRPRG